MKRISVIADLHSNQTAFEKVLEHMPRVDRVICAGDLVGYGACPNEIVELVRSRDVLTVIGDHDYAVSKDDFSLLDSRAREAALWTCKELKDKNFEFLRGLPQSTTFSIEGRDIYIVHGSPRDPLEGSIYPEISNQFLVKFTQKVDADIVVLGHTHLPVERTIQGKLIINPGSVGQPRDRDPSTSYMVLKLGRKIEVELERLSYDVDSAVKAIRKAGLPEELGTRLFFGW